MSSDYIDPAELSTNVNNLISNFKTNIIKFYQYLQTKIENILEFFSDEEISHIQSLYIGITEADLSSPISLSRSFLDDIFKVNDVVSYNNFKSDLTNLQRNEVCIIALCIHFYNYSLLGK
jgi:hypothetical protein